MSTSAAQAHPGSAGATGLLCQYLPNGTDLSGITATILNLSPQSSITDLANASDGKRQQKTRPITPRAASPHPALR